MNVGLFNYIVVSVLMVGTLDRIVSGQTCKALLRCQDCYLFGCLLAISNPSDEMSCVSVLTSQPGAEFVAYTAATTTSHTCRYACASSLYKTSGMNSVSFRYGPCVNGCNNVTLASMNSRAISTSITPDYVLNSVTSKEACKTHCINVVFNGTECTSMYSSSGCKIYTNCPVGGCSTNYQSGSYVDTVTCDYQLIKCSLPTSPIDGFVVYSGIMAGDTASYSCKTGYTIDISADRTCGTDSNWDGVQPSCTLVDCNTPWSLTDGSVSVTVTTYLGEATYSCSTGFMLTGSRFSTCQDDGSWNGTQPSCDPIDCYSPLPITDGSLNVNSTLYQATAIYTCHTGYNITGSPMVTCETDGSWSDTPRCDPVICVTSGTLLNGVSNIMSTVYQGVVMYSCDNGYNITGPSTRTCQADGNWDGVLPTCDPVDCGLLISINDGSVNISSTFYQGTVTYTCDNGYILSGPSSRSCQADGDWDGIKPLCDPVDCGNLTNIDNGTIAITGTTYQQTAAYTCDTGFIIDGPVSRTCQQDGYWTGSDPSCLIDCGDLDTLENGVVLYNATHVTSVAEYVCNTNCTLNGDNQTMCLSNGSWSFPDPACSCPDCPLLSDPLNGVVSMSNSNSHGSSATYTCNAGFTLSVPFTRTCNSAGSWTAQEPTCDGTSPGNKTKSIYIAPCWCLQSSLFENMSENEIIAQLIQDTKIDERSTALAQQKLSCKDDPRASSTIIGSAGIAIIAVIFGMFVLIDCITLCQQVAKSRQQYVRQR